MSNNVDRRVVEMQFDNKDFETNVQTSVKSLDRLKKSLDLEESAKGLSAFEKAGKSFSLDGMVAAAEAVTSKFSVMGTMGDQVLRRIGDAAFNALHKMKGFVDSLTIEPIFSGRQEYETQINSIQTILSNTRDKLTKQGYSDAERLEIVNDRLDTLNRYADKTIYNFTEMTRNIGTFTAAGVELDTAVQSIQGIANLAAVSGSTSEQASRGMYQLSQAISTGTVKLMDWNSVVNAGMGGELFQKALIRTATAMNVTVDKTVTEVGKGGKKIKKTVKKNAKELVEEAGSFRESLSDGWLTADVLTATLEQFSWDFEQMAKDMGYTAANMEEGIAKAMDSKRAELLSQGYSGDEADEIIQLAKDATDAATKVKTFTQLFSTLKEAAQSGWTQTWEYIIGNFNEAQEMLTGISDFFGKIIESSAEARNQIMKEWHDAGGRDMLFNNDPEKGALGAFWNLVYGIQNATRMVREELQKIFPPATSKTLLTFTEKIQAVTANFKAWTENSDGVDKLRRIVAGIGSALGLVRSGISYVWNGFKNLTGFTKSAGNGLLDFAAGLGDSIVKMTESIKTSDSFRQFLNRVSDAAVSVRDSMLTAFNAVRAAFAKLWAKIKDSGILTKIGEGISDFVGRIPKAISQLREWVKGIIDYVKQSEMLKMAWENIRKFFEPAIKGITDFGKRFREGLKAFFDKDVSSDESLWENLKARLSAFGSAFGNWFETVKSTVSNVWQNIKNFLSNFFTKTIPDFFNSSKVGTSGLIARIKSINWADVIKTAVGILAGFRVLTGFSGMKSIGKGLKNVGKGLKGIGEGIEDVIKNGITLKKKDAIGSTLLKIAGAIAILVGSIYVLAKMDTEDVVKGLGIISIIAAELLAVSLLFGRVGGHRRSFTEVAKAILLLVIPIKLLGAMDAAEALKGIAAIGLIMTELGLFTRLASSKKLSGLIGMSIAINILVFAVKNLADLDSGKLVKGLIGMGVLMLEMSAFAKKIGGTGKFGAMVGMAIAVNALVTAVKRMGKLNAEMIAKGVIGLGGIMTAFGVMIKMTKGMKLGNSLVLLFTMAGSIILFIEAFKQIDGMNTDNMVKFSISLSAAMLALSVAMKIVSTIPISGALTGLANFAIFIVGVGGIIAALGWLQSEWSGLTGFLESGGNVLGQIGHALGKFVGSIYGGIVEGFNMPQLGTDLSAFMTNAQGFIEGAKTIDGSVVTGVGYLAAALLAIGGTEFVNALVEYFAGDNPVTKFSGDLKTLGEGLMGYAESIKGFSDQATSADFSSSVSAAEGLANVASKLPSTGGKLQEWLGSPNLAKFSTDIVALAIGLKAYAISVKGFSKLASTTDMLQSIIIAKRLADLNNSLPATGGKLQDWIGQQDLSSFATKIVELSGGLMKYAEGVSGFAKAATEDDLNRASETALALSSVNNSLPATDGKLQDWLGHKNISKFATQITNLADGLIEYATKINGFSQIAKPEDLSMATSVATALCDINRSLPPIGGKLQDWLGEQSLSSFSEDIVKLSSGLVSYATNIAGFTEIATEDDLKMAVSVAQNLASVNNSLPPTGGKLDTLLFGEKDLGLFSTNIALLGGGLKTFAESIGGVTFEKADDAFSVMDIFQDFVTGLDSTGSIWDTLGDMFGEGSKFNTLLSYTEAMKQMGVNLGTFSSSVSSIKDSKVEYASTIFGEMQRFINGLESSGNLWSWFGEKFGAGSKFETLTDVTDSMATFGTNLKIFTDGIADAETATVNFEIAKRLLESFRAYNDSTGLWGEVKSTDQFSNLLWIIEDYGTALSTFSSNANGMNIEAVSAAANMISSIIYTLETAALLPNLGVEPIQTLLNNLSQITIPEFDTEGIEAAKVYIDSLSSGLEDGSAVLALTTAITGLSASGSNAAEGTYNTWYASGQYLAAGLSAGINSMAASVKNSAVSVAAGAIRSIQMTWSVHSPSKVGEDLGMFFDLGLAGGLGAYAKVVSQNAADVGSGAVESAKTMLRGINGSIFDNIDPNPTIRPVMDLSNIQNGVGVIGEMLRSEQLAPVGLFGGFHSVKGINDMSFDGGKISGGLSDKNIVSRLDSLTNHIVELGEAVTNMKIVLDSGELVGATTRKIDDSLGTLSMRKGRGN